jgi:hypothetical protein
MGMDVYGKAPSSPKGEYFRNNVWWWRPLADYCLEVSPETTASCSGWHTNDGDGLGEKDSLELAADLRACLLSGTTLESERRRTAHLSVLPSESMESWYRFSEDNVREWVEFLESCGGFEIR